MKAYLLLRWRVLERQLAELGWWRILLLGALLVITLGMALVTLSRHTAGQWLLPPVAFLLTSSQHRQRTDLDFLHLTAPRFRPWLAVEYALWSLPVAVVLCGFGRVGAALLTLALVPLVAWMPPARRRSTAQQAHSLFRSEAFELVSGTRQLGVRWAWLLLILGAWWWRQYAVAPAVALGVWVLLLASVYATPEPWTMLLPALRQPRAWLWWRVGMALLYFALTAAPFAWLLGTTRAGGAGALLLWGGAVQAMVVLARYAFYPNALLVRLTQGAVVAVACLLFGHPVYPVLLLVAFFGLMWKSHQQLSTFRND